jgi:hypothetical protein
MAEDENVRLSDMTLDRMLLDVSVSPKTLLKKGTTILSLIRLGNTNVL